MRRIKNTVASKLSVIEELSKKSEPPLAVMTRPPADPVVREQIGDQVWTGIVGRFGNTLSERDRGLWSNPPPDPLTSPEHMRVLHSFDDFLLSQFNFHGWKLLMSSQVLQRISEWTKHSPELLRRLGHELELNSLIFLGKKSAPLPDDIEKFADGAIEELQRLLRRQRDEFGARPVVPSCSRIAAWMKLEIESRPEDFPRLLGNLAQLCAWVEGLPDRKPAVAKALRRGDLRPRSLLYQLYADSTNRSVKAVRNAISSRRTQR